MEFRVYRCSHCGNLAFKLVDSGVPMFCCGQEMDELAPNTTDGAFEKHVPAVSKEGDKITVKVGSVPHPMVPEHYIQVIAAVADDTMTIRFPKPGEAAELTCVLPGFTDAYEFCNLHGFWKSK